MIRGNGKIIGILVIAVVVVGGGYYFVSSRQGQRQPPQATSNATDTSESAGWRTYRNEEYKFELKIPEHIGGAKRSEYPPTFILYTNEGGISVMEIRLLTTELRGALTLETLREVVNIESEEDVVVDNKQGQRIIGNIQQTGAPVHEVWVEYRQYIYALKGKGSDFDKLLTTFTFLD